jgi:hypothetical protein
VSERVHHLCDRELSRKPDAEPMRLDWWDWRILSTTPPRYDIDLGSGQDDERRRMVLGRYILKRRRADEAARLGSAARCLGSPAGR